MKKEDTKEVTITISGGITDELGMTVFTTICSTKAVINFDGTRTTIVEGRRYVEFFQKKNNFLFAAVIYSISFIFFQN